jgi:DNA-binding SARP family transcriptional activator/tetratricopeptide (TPR) repeat protein
MTMEFRLLGALEVWQGDRLLRLGGPKQRALLATLLLRAGQVVPVDQLIDALWDQEPPASARTIVHGYVSTLRKLLDCPDDGQAVIVTKPPGYELRLGSSQRDLDRFEMMVAEAGRARAAGALQVAAGRLRTALALWRGPALSNLAPERLRVVEAARLDARRTAALEERIEVDLELGRHVDLVGELEALVLEHPFRERLRAQLMLVLYRSGRQAEALQVFRDLRELLAEELGIEPDPSLQRLQRAILTADPGLQGASAGDPNVEAPVPMPVPRQLPPDVAGFTGRHHAVAVVRTALDPDDLGQASPAMTAVVAISGPAGVGKTALAVRVAHQLREKFPDGQLFVDLQGAEGRQLEPGDVLGGFLRALGVHGRVIPERVDERASLYRSLLSERQILVVLDNAAREAQVRPLLPASPTCAVLLTSRIRLSGLESGSSLTLDVLEPGQAVELLATVAGRARVVAEPDAAQAVARLCGHLPLAVRVGAARLAAKPHWRLADLAGRLADERRRLDELAVGDLEVRASVAFSYQGQDELHRRAFRLLGLLRVPDFAVWTAAALLDAPPDEAERVIERLVDAHLIEVAGQDAAGQVRYRLHDLLRVFARERLAEEEPSSQRAAILARLLDHCLALTHRANALLGPPHMPLLPSEQDPATCSNPMTFPSRTAAVAWLEAERAGLVSAVTEAATLRPPDRSWQLANALFRFFDERMHQRDWQAVNRTALAAARRAGDPVAEAQLLRNMGVVAAQQHRYRQAIALLDRGLVKNRAAGNPHDTALILSNIGRVYSMQRRFDEAVGAQRESLAISRELDSPHGESVALNNLGITLGEQGRFEEAIACLEQSLAIDRRLGDVSGEAVVLNSLGEVYTLWGRLDEAAACLEQALAISRRCGSRFTERTSLTTLADVYAKLGRLDEAAACLEQGLAISRNTGDRAGQEQARRALARMERRRRHLARPGHATELGPEDTSPTP